MPCYDSRDDASEIRREMAYVEALLCGACKVLHRLNYDFGENPVLDEWWDKHKKEDERKKRVALNAND